MAVVGAVSFIIGLLLLVSPINVGVPELRWLVGPYAMMFGVTLAALSRRLRQIAQEMAGA
jgi:uncharacterized membrane protein HdeD (DUF308 family)